jgi:tetratricopeptide (TPR) repeat protein
MADATKDVPDATKDAPSAIKKSFDWVALVAAIAAVVAAVYTFWSAHVASEQNIAAEQQQLLTITTSIAGQIADEQSTLTQAAGALTGTARKNAINNASIGVDNQLTADGEAAQVLITKLGGNGVAGVEYVQVGKALVDGGDIADAIDDFEDAVNAPPHASDTEANALRNEGMLRYSLSQNAAAHQDYMRAVSVYADHPQLTQGDIRNSIALSYAGDAAYQIPLGTGGCHTASVDLQDARQEIAPLVAGGETSQNAGTISSDEAAYQSKCIA